MMGESFLLPEGFHNWQRNVRLNSMMTPTMLLNAEDDLEFVCGSGGAGRIPFMIAQMIESIYKKGMTLDEAMLDPRIYLHNGIVQYESGYRGELIESLESKEWKERSLFFGGVHSLLIDNKNEFHALGDPRRYGAATLHR
jgi:gamma-glutamyltranspeptidase/glutathione hydrolase